LSRLPNAHEFTPLFRILIAAPFFHLAAVTATFGFWVSVSFSGDVFGVVSTAMLWILLASSFFLARIAFAAPPVRRIRSRWFLWATGGAGDAELAVLASQLGLVVYVFMLMSFSSLIVNGAPLLSVVGDLLVVYLTLIPLSVVAATRSASDYRVVSVALRPVRLLPRLLRRVRDDLRQLFRRQEFLKRVGIPGTGTVVVVLSVVFGRKVLWIAGLLGVMFIVALVWVTVVIVKGTLVRLFDMVQVKIRIRRAVLDDIQVTWLKDFLGSVYYEGSVLLLLGEARKRENPFDSDSRDLLEEVARAMNGEQAADTVFALLGASASSKKHSLRRKKSWVASSAVLDEINIVLGGLRKKTELAVRPTPVAVRADPV
jgi:hypothetical protein